MILAGVPRGSPISPILFSIFINDIPIENEQNVSFSLLFADDLAYLGIFKQPGQIKHLVSKYLKIDSSSFLIPTL
jgi:hypothetical protein